MKTSILSINSTARGGLFFSMKTVNIMETVELFGSVATILRAILASLEF